MATVCDACGHKTNEVKSGCKFSVQQKGSWKAISCSWFLFVFHAFIHFIRLCLLVGSVGLVSGDCRGGRGFKNPSWCFIVVQVDKCSEILPTPDYSKIRGKIKTSANGQTLWSSQIRTVNRRPHLTTFNIHIPVRRKEPTHHSQKIRAWSSRCGGLCFVTYRGLADKWSATLATPSYSTECEGK